MKKLANKTTCIVIEESMDSFIESGVYLLVGPSSIPYVGMSVDIERRLSEHARKASRALLAKFEFVPGMNNAVVRDAEQFMIDVVRRSLGLDIEATARNSMGRGRILNRINARGLDGRSFVRRAFRFCN